MAKDKDPKAALPQECCMHCRYYRPDESGAKPMTDDDRECRRYPPTVIVIDGEGIGTYETPVDAGDWCGEWKPKH
jgi:hypothetical protein